MLLEVKRHLVFPTRLTYLVPHMLTVLSTNFSAEAVGLVLHQDVAGELWSVAFSKRLEPAQLSYSAFNSELIAVHETNRHFWLFFLEGRQFHLLMEYKLLTPARGKIGYFTHRVCRQLGEGGGGVKRGGLRPLPQRHAGSNGRCPAPLPPLDYTAGPAAPP